MIDIVTKIGIEHYLVLSAIIFTIGASGLFVNRKNIISILMSIEIMLLSANINLLAFANYLGDITGQVASLLILSIAAAEAAIGLAILVLYFRQKGSIEVKDLSQLRG